MTNILDEKMREFINMELDNIKSDKERVTEEKRRIRTEIHLYEKTLEENGRLKLLKRYDDVLREQYNLLCKRDIAIFQLIAGIGESARNEAWHHICSVSNSKSEDSREEYPQAI